jgi:hypothetical protein
MIIENEHTSRVEEFGRKADQEAREREERHREDARLTGEIISMRRHGRSLERSGNQQRISNYNRRFVSTISRISVIRQTTPRVTSADREAAEDAMRGVI